MEANDRYVNGTENLDQYQEYLEKDKELKFQGFPAEARPVIRTSANNIHAVDLWGEDRNSEAFWNHHGKTKEDYYELASHIPEVQKRIDSGENLEDLYQDTKVGACAMLYFDPSHMARVTQYKDTFISQGDNRHRILAAQDLGHDIPVRVSGTWSNTKGEDIMDNENNRKSWELSPEEKEKANQRPIMNSNNSESDESEDMDKGQREKDNDHDYDYDYGYGR